MTGRGFVEIREDDADTAILTLYAIVDVDRNASVEIDHVLM